MHDRKKTCCSYQQINIKHFTLEILHHFSHSFVILYTPNQKRVDSDKQQRELFAHRQIPQSKKHYTVTRLQTRFTNGRIPTKEEEKKRKQQETLSIRKRRFL